MVLRNELPNRSQGFKQSFWVLCGDDGSLHAEPMEGAFHVLSRLTPMNTFGVSMHICK
jgi:hypothetical protein